MTILLRLSFLNSLSKISTGSSTKFNLASIDLLQSYAITGLILINRGLIHAIPTSLPPQLIGEATKASNLQRIPPGVQGRSHFIYIYHSILHTIEFSARFDSLPYSAFVRELMLLLLNSSMRTRRSKEQDDTENVDIETLTLEQYLALDLNNTRRRFTYLDNSTFEVKGQLLRELQKSQNHHDEIIQGLKSRVTTLAKEAVTKTDKNKDCKAIFTDDGAPLYTLFYYSPEEIKYFSANSRFSDDDEFKNITPIPDEGTSDDEDDIEGIIDYLEPTSYDGFVDLDEEEYNKRRCRLLGMPYIEPLLIIIEQVKITRYSLGPGEGYTKLKVSNMEELPRTRNNVTTIRSNIMDEVFENYEDEMT
ncbi:hypothetical protein Tco_0177996 [Tanacetum coccineum]